MQCIAHNTLIFNSEPFVTKSQKTAFSIRNNSTVSSHEDRNALITSLHRHTYTGLKTSRAVFDVLNSASSINVNSTNNAEFLLQAQ